MLRSVWLGVLAGALMLCVSACTQKTTVTRVAVDIGSGGLKVTAADVDVATGQVQKIHYQKEHPVPLKRDLSRRSSKHFSPQVQQQAYNTLVDVKELLKHLGPVPWRGIATAASRQAENAEEMYDWFRRDLGVDIEIISQKEEGRLGFQTALALSGSAADEVIAYDSGSGSFQISSMMDGDLQVVEGKIGYIPALTALIEEVRGESLDATSSPNPVSLIEARALKARLAEKLPKVSPVMRQRLDAPGTRVYGIGNDYFIFAYGAVGTGKSTYTRDELWAAIERHAGLKDEELMAFAKPDEALVGMILLYTVMEGLEINELTHVYANGSCEGVLVDSDFWN